MLLLLLSCSPPPLLLINGCFLLFLIFLHWTTFDDTINPFVVFTSTPTVALLLLRCWLTTPATAHATVDVTAATTPTVLRPLPPRPPPLTTRYDAIITARPPATPHAKVTEDVWVMMLFLSSSPARSFFCCSSFFFFSFSSFSASSAFLFITFSITKHCTTEPTISLEMSSGYKNERASKTSLSFCAATTSSSLSRILCNDSISESSTPNG